MPNPAMTYAPDGLAAGMGRPLALQRASGTRKRRGVRITDLILDQLPIALCVIDSALRLRYCNLQAAMFLETPDFTVRGAPPLVEALQGCTRIPARQKARLVAFCSEQIATETEDQDKTLRLSIARDTRLTIRLGRLDRDNWLLTIEDKSAAGAEPWAQDAWRDPLTGLPNRRRFNRVLDDEIRGAGPDAGFSLLVIDIDRFKIVNDTLGHAVGDALLCLVAQRLRRDVREGDILARIGGDEFMLLARGGNTVGSLGSRVVQILSRPFLVEGNIVKISASVGIVHYPDHGRMPDALLHHADLALYCAKTAGRGKVCIFQPEIRSEALARRGLETDLRKAMALDEFSVVYQPQMNLRAGVITGFEALLRWNHPVRGAIPPSEFILVAEDLGCIAALGEWVLRKACQEAAEWSPNLTVAVKVSPRQLADAEAFYKTAHAALQAAGLPAGRLELEMTGSSLLAPHPGVLDVLQRLRNDGVRIAVDDFGTACSSLSQFRSLPYTGIKIDHGFTEELDAGGDSAAVIRAVNKLGAGRGMAAMAEDVETSKQAAIVEADGCTGIQRFMVSRPVPSRGDEKLLHLPHPFCPAEPAEAQTDTNARMAMINAPSIVAGS